jgi:hypothetical protein
MSKQKTKVLVFDIETSPNLGWTWAKYEQNVIEFDREWYMLCYASKWLGQKQTKVYSLPDYERYKQDPEDDYEVVKMLRDQLDEADIVIAHNGDSFDIKKANARFIHHKLTPPSPYKTIDTKKVAKRYFRFNSNKLDDLGQLFDLGKKVNTGGFELWKGCMQGDMRSWRKMAKYNKQDVDLLEKVYLHMRPWMNTHHNMNVLSGKAHACPKCESTNMQRRGYSINKVSKTQRWQCQGCGGWSSGKVERLTDIEIR